MNSRFIYWLFILLLLFYMMVNNYKSSDNLSDLNIQSLDLKVKVEVKKLKAGSLSDLKQVKVPCKTVKNK